MANAFNILLHNTLGLKLEAVSIRELFYVEEAPCNVFAYENNKFKAIIPAGKMIDSDFLKNLLKKNIIKIFVPKSERYKIIETHQNVLVRLTRSLSMGENIERVKKQLNVLTITLQHLYEDPTNDEILMTQFQGIKNLFQFLINHPENHFELYKDYNKSRHHFIFSQPMISSLFLAGVLKSSHLFAVREMENLFITSYFKDIGMSAIPYEKYDQVKLSKKDRKTFLHHPENSVRILSGRIALSHNFFKIIQGHHSFSTLRNAMLREEEPEFEDQLLIGSETILVMALDIFTAMISARPYRKAISLFDALELLKSQIGNQYPKEFKLIVSYFRTFFAQGGEQKSA